MYGCASHLFSDVDDPWVIPLNVAMQTLKGIFHLEQPALTEFAPLDAKEKGKEKKDKIDNPSTPSLLLISNAKRLDATSPMFPRHVLSSYGRLIRVMCSLRSA